MDSANNFYNQDLKHLARELRKNGTKAERLLWLNVLKNRQMLGFRFIRQRPIGKYIADFFCKELKLIIEVDGLTHQFEENYKKEKDREAELTALDFYILRFHDNEIYHDLDNVIRTIQFFIEANSTIGRSPT